MGKIHLQCTAALIINTVHHKATKKSQTVSTLFLTFLL